MQTPGRRVEPQTSMLPLERRMDSLERRFINFSNAQQPDEDTSVRGLGRIVLEMEQMQNNMEAMQKEIQRDIRERAKYFKEEQKLLKKDLKNTEDFKTAALFDLRKIIGLFGFAVAANELSQGDIGGAIQGVGLGIGSFLPEIATGVVGILAAKGLIGGGMMGGSMMGGGMAAGGLGMLGGKGKGILALAALGGLLLAGGALGGGGNTSRKQVGNKMDAFEGNNVIDRSDTIRFREQLGRFDGIITDVGTPTSQNQSASVSEQGMNLMSQEKVGNMPDMETEERETPKQISPEQEQEPAPSTELTDAQIEAIIEANGGRDNIMPAAMSPISEEELIEARSTIIPPDRIVNENNISENVIENLSWSPAPKQPVVEMDTDSKDFNALTAISALEAGDDQARADVAQSIYNRVADTGDYGDTVFEVITRDNQYQPAFEDPTSSDFQPTAKIWKDITDKQSAIAAMLSYYEKRGQVKTKAEMLSLFEQTASALKSKDLQTEAREHVGGRTEFLGGQVSGNDVVDRGGIEDNAFFAEYGSGTQLDRGAQPIPAEIIAPEKPSFWDMLNPFKGNLLEDQAQVLPSMPRDREVPSSMIAQPIIANIPGKVTSMPPPSTGEDEFGGEQYATISTRFQGSIDKLDSAYALNSYAALS